MEYEKCYLFKPEGPPRKRRRLEGLHRSWPVRRKLFNQAWNELDIAFTNTLQTVNAKTRTDIGGFLSHYETNTRHVPCGIILAQPGTSLLAINHNETTQIITLTSVSATSLKNALKAINSHAIKNGSSTDFATIDDAEDAEDDDSNRETTPAKALKSSTGRRLLAYDLSIIEEYARTNSITSIVVHLEDTEGFSAEVLSSLIIQLSLWRDRIPLSMIMSISTSVDMLERRLTSAARKRLKCQLFEAATCQQEFQAIMDIVRQSSQNAILDGKVIKWAAQRQADYLHDITSLRNELKYTLMTAYFANPLTVFLGDTTSIEQDHFDALRCTPAFKERVRQLLDEGDHTSAKALLTNNEALQQDGLAVFAVQPPAHVFAPKTRQAIERALSSPLDYLGGDDDHSHSTAQLYSLLQESGSLVNVHDAWQAFDGQQSLSDATSIALFQRSLAELRHIGALKSTKMRIDHVAKAAWPGL